MPPAVRTAVAAVPVTTPIPTGTSIPGSLKDCSGKRGRLASLNFKEKPSLTRNYSSDNARARAIRRRVMGKVNVNNSARNGPLFGLKKNRCPNYCDKKGKDCGANAIYSANNGSSSDFTYFKKIAGGNIKINPCANLKGC